MVNPAPPSDDPARHTAKADASRPLPPGFEPSRFATVLGELASIVGEDNVRRGEAVDPYDDPFVPAADPRAFAASAAVLPANVDEIRAILRVANGARLPLWTVSTGRNFAYGGAAPRLSGSVVLDLQRMNRVLDVNESLAYALVEPGVSYYDLYAALRQRNSALWVDPPAAGWGSVVGNTLERGFGYTPYGDHAATQCGMEVVLANGDVVRTGMGGIDTGTAWQLFRPGYGPSFDPMFMQSNYGIVTKMGVWLMPAPPAYLLGEIQFAREDDLGVIVDTLRALQLGGTIRHHAVIEGAIRRAASITPRARWYDGAGPMPESAVEAIQRDLGVGRWNLHYALYGERAVIDAQRRVVERAFAAVPGVRFAAKRYAANEVPQGGGARLARRPRRARRFFAAVPGGGRRRVAPVRAREGTRRRVRLRLLRRLHGGRASSASCIRGDLRARQPGRRRARRRPAARVDERCARGRLRRLPFASAVHGLRGCPVWLQRRRVAAPRRDGEGRTRPERRAVAGQAGDLAASVAGTARLYVMRRP
jgi:4-cresol dehydrogenase (hydroxylating)